MTPQSPTRRTDTHPRRLRRAAAFVVAVTAIGGAPLVAEALETEPATESLSGASVIVSRGVSIEDAPQRTERRGQKPVFQPTVEARASEPEPESEPEAQPSESVPDVDPPAEPVVDPAVSVLTATYEWDERGARVEALQQILGVSVDGWYGQQTATAHRSALEFQDLETDTVPVPVLPPGPSAEKWAALRQCEAGGDYSITSASGKYRGAYQFDQSTWNSVAERHAPQLVGVHPAEAAPADQDALALALYRERGANPWPHCGRHLR